jgi:hypothetical protein
MGERIRGPHQSSMPYRLDVTIDSLTFQRESIPWLESDACQGRYKINKRRFTRDRRIRFSDADAMFAFKMRFG